MAQFLHDELKLELSAEKTLITHARSHTARYLGYEITVQHGDSKITDGRRSVNGLIGLRVPTDVIKAKRADEYRASSSTTCLPTMSGTSTGSAGTPRPRC